MAIANTILKGMLYHLTLGIEAQVIDAVHVIAQPIAHDLQ